MRLTHDDQMRQAGLMHEPPARITPTEINRSGTIRAAVLASTAGWRLRSQGSIKTFLATAAAVQRMGARSR